jgi:predicted transglutaminase-like cysteine proteinase
VRPTPATRRKSLWLATALLAVTIATAGASELTTISDEQIEALVQRFGPTVKERLAGWKDILTDPKYRQLPDREKLELVNRFMSRTAYTCDPTMWCMEDYWAMPVEFLANEGGDCEDFTIAKYYTLLALGVPGEKLGVAYVKETRVSNGHHMVLAYYAAVGDEPLILDNLVEKILPASQRPDLIPVYTVNGSGLWNSKEARGRTSAAPTGYAHKAWGDFQRRSRLGEILSITAAQRRSPECEALRARHRIICPW